VLTNEEKKQLYDKHGMKGLEKGFGRSGNPFADLFGFGHGGQQDKEYRKMKPKVLELKVSLEDVYLGKMVTQKVSLRRICDACEGLGGKSAKVKPPLDP
jgi:DnaJ family protein A protein 2